jgi:hypothetical protein
LAKATSHLARRIVLYPPGRAPIDYDDDTLVGTASPIEIRQAHEQIATAVTRAIRAERTKRGEPAHAAFADAALEGTMARWTQRASHGRGSPV